MSRIPAVGVRSDVSHTSCWSAELRRVSGDFQQVIVDTASMLAEPIRLPWCTQLYNGCLSQSDMQQGMVSKVLIRHLKQLTQINVSSAAVTHLMEYHALQQEQKVVSYVEMAFHKSSIVSPIITVCFLDSLTKSTLWRQRT